MTFPKIHEFTRYKTKRLRRGIPNLASLIDESLHTSDFKRKLKGFSIIDFQKIHDRTMGQSSNPSWKFYRMGLITCTILKNIVIAVKKGQSSQKINNSIEKKRDYKLFYPAVVWGVRNEYKGLLSFWNEFKKNHNDPFMSKHGLKIDDNLKIWGGSVDGMCYCSCHGKAVIEVKCSYKLREQGEDERWNELMYIKNGSLNPVHYYNYQIHGYMILYNVIQTWFVVWTPGNTLILHIKINQDLSHEIKESISEYYYTHYLAHVL